jgi:hypothetical protein
MAPTQDVEVGSADEDDTLETIALIPSQPGPNEFEKSELGLTEQGNCKPMNVYNNTNMACSADGLQNGRQLSIVQQDATDPGWISKRQLYEKGMNEDIQADLQAVSSAHRQTVKSTRSRSEQTLTHPATVMVGLPESVKPARTQMGVGLLGPKHQATIDPGAAGDGPWVTGSLDVKMAPEQRIMGGRSETQQGFTGQPPGYRSYPNRKHAKLWTQFDDLPVSNTFTKRLQNPPEMRFSAKGEITVQNNIPERKSQHQVTTQHLNPIETQRQSSANQRLYDPPEQRFQTSAECKIPRSSDRTLRNPSEQGFLLRPRSQSEQSAQNPVRHQFPNPLDWSVKNPPNQILKHPMELTFNKLIEQNPSNYDLDTQRKSLPVRNPALSITSRTPGIAPVTPRVRPLQALGRNPADDQQYSGGTRHRDIWPIYNEGNYM